MPAAAAAGIAAQPTRRRMTSRELKPQARKASGRLLLAAIVAIFAAPRSPIPHMSEPAGHPTTRTVGDIGADDAAMRDAARAAPPAEPIAEAEALSALFDDESVHSLCAAKIGAARWASPCLEKWERWKGAPRAALGGEITRVVEALDGPHLLPSGIRERLLGGNDAACFGLAALLTNMLDEPPSQES